MKKIALLLVQKGDSNGEIYLETLGFRGKYGRRHNCRFVFTPVADFDQCEQNHVESMQRHLPP